MADKSREEKLAEALGGFWNENGVLSGETSYLEKAVRQRVRELLDESGLYYSHKRDPEKGGRHHIEIVNPDYPNPVWYSGHFADSELPEKEQSLLLWLAGQVKRKNV